MSTSPSAPLPAELPVRIAARALDVLVLAGIDVALGAQIGHGFDWLIVGTVIVLAYFAGFDAVTGATPGKLAFGLRVTSSDGGRPSLRQALKRELVTIVGSIPFIGPLLALIAWISISRKISRDPLRQGQHDQLAGTRVIRVTAS